MLLFRHFLLRGLPPWWARSPAPPNTSVVPAASQAGVSSLRQGYFPFLQQGDHIWLPTGQSERGQGLVGLQHDVPVQTPLCGAQPLPLLLGEIDGQVPERHWRPGLGLQPQGWHPFVCTGRPCQGRGGAQGRWGSVLCVHDVSTCVSRERDVLQHHPILTHYRDLDPDAGCQQ